MSAETSGTTSRLGLSDSLCFLDLLSLYDPELLAFLPRLAYALILVFPTTEAYDERIGEEAGLEDFKGSDEDDAVFFKQTINNAYGLYAILHAVCNGEASIKIGSDSVIARLLDTNLPPTPDDLARALEDSEKLEVAYAGVASKGDTEAPTNAEDKVDYHYIAFVKSHKNNRLYQLDGDRKRPIDLGLLTADDDVLSDKCLHVIRSIMTSEDNNLNFSLMALVEEYDA